MNKKEDFFMSFFVSDEGGYYSLTTGGLVVLIILIVLLLAAMAMIFAGQRGKKKAAKITTQQMVCSAAMLALAVITSYIKLWQMPWGGSVTLFSMLFICVIGYWYGARIGLISAFIYGILQFLLGGETYILSIWQVCFDYIFAFTMLGLSGFFSKRKNGLTAGYIAGIIGRGVMASIAGYLYWMDYMPDNFPKALTVVYPILYNFAYILAEGAVTLIVINLPPVKKVMIRIKTMARGEK